MKYYNGLPVHKTFERIMGQTWGSYARLHYPQLVESAKARHQQRVLDVRREQYEWTKEKLIFAVKGFVQQNGRVPLIQEYTIENGLPSYSTFCKIAEQAMVGYVENCFVGHFCQSDVLKENDAKVDYTLEVIKISLNRAKNSYHTNTYFTCNRRIKGIA